MRYCGLILTQFHTLGMLLIYFDCICISIDSTIRSRTRCWQRFLAYGSYTCHDGKCVCILFCLFPYALKAITSVVRLVSKIILLETKWRKGTLFVPSCSLVPWKINRIILRYLVLSSYFSS